jgi:hypothetical protein
MRTFGQIIFSIGILLIIGGFFVPVSTHVGYMPADSYLSSMPSDAINIHGLHIQALVFQGGFTGLIVGALLEGFGLINETLTRNARPPAILPVPTEPTTDLPDETSPLIDLWSKETKVILALLGAVIIVVIIAAIFRGQPISPREANEPYDANMVDENLAIDTNVSGNAIGAMDRASRAANEAAAAATNAADAAVRATERGGR